MARLFPSRRPIGIRVPLLGLLLAIAALTATVGPPAASAAGTSATLRRLRHELTVAARAQRRHRLLSVAAYRRLGRDAAALRKVLGGARCRAALTAAADAARAGRRARGSRAARRALGRALRRARAGIGACRVPTVAPPPQPPTGGAPKPPPATISGTVLDSLGRPLGGLPIRIVVQTSPRGELYGHSAFDTVTRSDGRFTIAQDPARIGALAFRAEAAFPWRGGTWPRDLVTMAAPDAQHLLFHANRRHVVATDGSWLVPGPAVRIGDSEGCTSLGPDSRYPASDPGTSSVTITFTPDGPLVDGTGATAFSGTITDTASLCGSGAQAEVPPGAWVVTGVSNSGRRLTFATSGGTSWSTALEVFGGPQGESSPTVTLDAEFATP